MEPKLPARFVVSMCRGGHGRIESNAKRNTMMKRSLILLVTLALLLGACAATAPGTTGVITEVNGNTLTVAVAGQPTTYTLTNRTLVYSPDGIESLRSYLSKGQRVMVWATGTNAVRINIES
jgi:PhoPQ-activated pathogenicity-related protein